MENVPITDAAGDNIRAVNADIGRNYDAIVYEPGANPDLDPAPVLGLAALYGCAGECGADFDVFDLGCGTGSQLERLGRLTRGRLVGADISQGACERASARCTAFGDRARILCADFLDLSPDTLGRFDLIYHIGVIFVTPPAVKRRILDLIGRCLKPGGVAVLSYYAGSMPLLRAGLHRTLRAALDPTQTREENIRRARQHINSIATSLAGGGPQVEVLKQLLQQAHAQTDVMFFHEALNHAWDVLDTPSIEQQLQQHGVQFLNYLTPTGFGSLATSRERALAADVLDFSSGGSYRHAIFGKPAAAGQGLTLQCPKVRWHTRLARVLPQVSYAGPVTYKDAVRNVEVRIDRAATQAALDELTAKPSTWAELSADMLRRLDAHGAPADNAAAYLEQGMRFLWNHRLVWPMWES